MRIKNALIWIYAALATASVGLLARDSYRTGIEPSDCSQVIAEQTKPGDPVMILSCAVSPAYPALIQLDREPGSRYLWNAPVIMLEYARRHASGESGIKRAQDEENLIAREICDDIRIRRPKLIMIEAHSPLGSSGTTLLQYCIRTGILANAFTQYDYFQQSNRFITWKLREAATNVGATSVGATSVGATSVGATSVGATNVRATNVRATNVGATNVGATAGDLTFVGARPCVALRKATDQGGGK